MTTDRFDPEAVPFAGEYLKRYELFLSGAAEIKRWRTEQFNAALPSSLKDYCYAHGFCSGCQGIGIALNEGGMGFKAVGWDGNTQLYEKCTLCAGTGRA